MESALPAVAFQTTDRVLWYRDPGRCPGLPKYRPYRALFCRKKV